MRLPNGVFAPYTAIPTNLIFFERNGPTREIWYYEQPLPAERKSYSKTKPLRFEEFQPLVDWWNDREENEQAWRVAVEDVLKYDGQGSLVSVNLDIKNPNSGDALEHLAPEALVAGIMERNGGFELMAEIQQAVSA